jgi:hypothetical protein
MKIKIYNYQYNTDGKSKYDWEEPTFDIGNGIIDLVRLTPCPDNDFYNKLEENENDIEAIMVTMEEILDVEGPDAVVNTERILVCPLTGTILSGHNRAEAAKRVGAKKVKVDYGKHVYDVEDLPEIGQREKMLWSYNATKRNEQSPNSLHLKLQGQMKTEELFNDEGQCVERKVTIKPKDRKYFMDVWKISAKDFASIRSIETIPDPIKRQEVILAMQGKLDKDKQKFYGIKGEKLETFSLLSKAVAKAKEKEPETPDKLWPWIRYYLKHFDLLEDTLHHTVIKLIQEMGMTDDRMPEKISKNSWGPKAITPIASHTLNETHETTMQLYGGIGMHCEMESGPLVADDKKEILDFDLFFPKLRDRGFDYENEMKSKSEDTEVPAFIFQLGAARLHTKKCYHLLQYSKDMKRFYYIVAMIHKTDVKSGKLMINEYLENHEEGEDYIIVHGKIKDGIIEGETYEV